MNINLIKEIKEYVRPICSICHENHKFQMCRLKCGHIFHDECVLEWSKLSNKCPECRANIKEPFNIRKYATIMTIDVRLLHSDSYSFKYLIQDRTYNNYYSEHFSAGADISQIPEFII